MATVRDDRGNTVREGVSGDAHEALDVHPITGEELRDYRVRESAPTFFADDNQGGSVRVGPGDTVRMTLAQARAAAQWVETPDGQAVPHEAQRVAATVARPSLAGMARHERIEALDMEKRALEERLSIVSGQLEHERAQIEDDRKRAAEGARSAEGPDPNVRISGGPAPTSNETRDEKREKRTVEGSSR